MAAAHWLVPVLDAEQGAPDAATETSAQLPAPSHWLVAHSLAEPHACPCAFTPSEGQALEKPEQVSATSHSPDAERQMVPALMYVCAGHDGALPGQNDGFWQGPLAAAHTVVDGRKVWAGQIVDPPVQYEALAQAVAAAHWVPAAA
jgi:hypothetical protein